MESTLNTIRQKTFINRGFLIGPYCPIYGVGMCILYILCFPQKNNLLLLFLCGIFFATLLEYITGYIMEKLFHAKWWDYHRFKFNLHGYICLHISLAWGFLSMLMIGWIHPIISDLVTRLPLSLGYVLLWGLCIVFILDFIYSTYTAFHLAAQFPALSEMRLELIILLEQSKLYEATEEFKTHFELRKVSSKITHLMDSIKEHLPQGTDFSKSQLYKLLSVKLSKYHAQLDQFSLAEKRLLKAFPTLSLTSLKSLKSKILNRGKQK